MKMNPLWCTYLKLEVLMAKFASLYYGVFIAERMGWREGHQSMNGLCTLVRPYHMPGQEPLR